MIRSSIPLAALVLGLTACTLIDQQAQLRSVVDQHVEARGGPYAVHSVQAVEMQMDVVEPKAALHARYLSNRSHCMQLDVYDQGRVLQSEGISTAGGWRVNAGDTAYGTQPDSGTQVLLHGIESPLRLIGLDEFPRRGNSLVDKGSEKLGGISYEQINAVYADGYAAELYLDPGTHLIVKMREHKPAHPAADPSTTETQFSDYRAVGGVMFPFYSREVNWQTGEELGHTTVNSLIVNSPAALAACERPRLPRF